MAASVFLMRKRPIDGLSIAMGDFVISLHFIMLNNLTLLGHHSCYKSTKVAHTLNDALLLSTGNRAISE